MLPTQSGAQPHANGAAPASRSRIDPNQIPSPVVVQEADQEAYADKPYLTLSKTVPPLPSTQFGAIDEGNCNPRAIRLTTYNLPCSDELQNMSSLPLGLIVQPMVDFSPVEMPIPVVDCGEAGPVRCKRCMAYINPFCKFIEGGRKFVCNLCTFETEVPAEYFSNLDMMGRRVDLAQRPELRYGSVEFTASKDYIARPPVPLSYVFAIDVSWSSHSSGLLARCAQSIKELLYGEPPVGVVSGRRGLPPGTKVGFLTFDRSVHFYNLKANLDHPQMLVVPDINEIFVPLNDGFLVDPNESRRPIEALLDSLPSLFQPSRLAETATGAAIQAAFLALKKTGGKLSIFQTCLPTFGPGALKVREEARVLGTDKERQLYEPQEYFWKKMGQDCATAGINVDFYLFPHAYIDVATLSTLSSLTGGDTYSYHNFEAARDGLKFGNDLKRNLLRSFAYDALLRIRCSNGLKLVDYFGNFYMKNATDVELAGIDSEKSIGVLIKHDGKLDEKVESSFQCALLYTNVFGERRLRIHNISVPNTTILGNVFRFAEMDTTLNYLAKAAVAQCMHTTLKAVRDQLTEKCVKILSAYRKHCASSTAAGQLILPESFKLYPLYALTLLKTQAFRGGPDMSTDLRVHHMKALRSMGLAETAPFFYPRMFAIHQGLHENVFQPGRRFVLPPGIRVSLERLESTGAYLVENGQQMMIWLGSNISPAFLKDVFGIDSLANIDIRLRELPRLDNDTSRKLHEAIVFVQSSRARFMQLQIVRQNMDPFLEAEFANMMVEDKNHDAMNYVDFLCYVHRQVVEDDVRAAGSAMRPASGWTGETAMTNLALTLPASL
ncbi:Sec23/Sec24 trunk domain-containing protein [Polychytrium aggregatum]|uniref:Sec23/Sec24 trunk domain-containing protein n=1 Tax=Polychytrium aggregatum TaxID=110093 RepID=UPI0022FDCEDC|nr:Sec23/Sec24 trunk domain-containing protein [Polychytrium aggregatum]KAI9206218.1 Sec23/Sec24 trunk domain-containing protein [Polychytrium aggregatum]